MTQRTKAASRRPPSRASAHRHARARPRGAVHKPVSQARTLKAKTAFIKEFAKRGIVAHACRVAKVGRRTFYSWIETDEAFRTLHAEALDNANDDFEAEAVRRGFEGVLEPVFQQGARVGTIRRYSDALCLAMLRSRRPNAFRDRIEHTGRNGGPIQTQALPIDPKDLSDEEIAVLERVLERQATKTLTHG